MIITRIIPHAGLGNQMFMYAAGLSAATRLGTVLRLCSKDFDNNQFGEDKRPYELGHFPDITEKQASFGELVKTCPGQVIINLLCYRRIKRGDIFRRTLRKAVNKSGLGADFDIGGTPSRLSRLYVQQTSGYSPEFEKIPDDTMISGYWESEKYFDRCADLVRRKFTFPAESFSPELSEKVRRCNSVAIHVRRGDKTYLAAPLPSDGKYIRHAIEKISRLTENPSFFVFSDDMEWCRKNLPLIYDAEYTFVEGQTPLQDMALMTLCRHVVMGPSTFSWWGAWLTEKPGKIVIAPDVKLWYKPGAYSPEERKDLLPERWVKIG